MPSPPIIASRWRLVLLAALCSSLLSCSRGANYDPAIWAEHTGGAPFVYGYAAGLAAAKQQQKPVMYLVTATWCGNCKRLAAECFTDPEARELLGHFVCVLIDGDGDSGAASRLGATAYPTVIFANRDGKPEYYVLGYKPQAEFVGTLKQAVLRFSPAGDSRPFGEPQPAALPLDAAAKGQ